MIKNITLFTSIALLSCQALAGELVYHPQNTAFGGDNASATQILMSKAQAQDTTEDPNKKITTSQTPLERFQNSLQSRILDQISREIVTGAFSSGDGSILNDTGTFSTDQFSITVNNDNPDSLAVSITDFATGNETVMEIPKF